MGDYYKIKKILLILIIVLTIIRIFKTSNVFAADDVNSSIQSGNYVVQTDNHFETLKNLSRDAQFTYIMQIMELLSRDDSTIHNNIVNSCRTLFNNIQDKTKTCFLYIDSSRDGIYIQEIPLTKFVNSNITISGYTWNDSYNFNNVPFLQFTRGNNSKLLYINASNGTLETITNSGTSVIIPIPSIGFLNESWMNVFETAGLITGTNDYEDILSTIEENLELMYTQEYYTKQAVQNTYNYLTNDDITEISSLGITQPEISEKIDLTDVFDSLENLLTNENYESKIFNFSLPGNRNFYFSLRPDYLETSLTRVGGSNIISIIHALWYIGLYGWYIFAYLGIFGKLLTGDLFHLVKGSSPVTNLVKMSVGSITGGKY